ncbi:MAG: esterase [Hyphomicrobiales bacterium]|nr:esterase [Hyphomicrobiales bacterium]
MNLRTPLALVALLSLAACGGRPEGVLTPTGAQAPGATRVDLLVATTRSADNVPAGEMFGGERAIGLNFADISVSIPPDAVRQRGEVQWPARMPPDPMREFATLKADRLDQAEALRRFHARVKVTPHRSVLLFVHGYNTRFEEAVYRLAQVTHDSRAPALPLLFTWPSRGKLMAYTYDRESANYSRDALESVLQYLAKDPAVGEITILAHSMGNWVTLEALRQMAIRDGRVASKIKNVMLAAPDVDVDVFRRQIRVIGDKRPPFTLFVSQDDKALGLSRRLWGNTPRLGAVDPAQEPYRTDFARDGLRVVDLTGEQSSDSLNHGKFAGSSEVVQMIGGNLVSGQALSDGKAGLGETLGLVAQGAASTVGRAASIAISAPVALVDARTRSGLSDQIEDLGGQVKGTLSSAGDAVPRVR